jgi:hypothetical protein
MNVIKLMGGLGNQLFQYAFGRVQMDNGIDVYFDNSTYSGKQRWPRPYRLDKFEINIKLHQIIKSQPTTKDKQTSFEIDLLRTDNRNFDGYWQFVRYYEDIIPTLQKELRVKTELYTDYFTKLSFEIGCKENSVSIHVRRGDYLVQTWGILPFTYYLQAVQHTEGDLYIFSDDVQWCKEHFKPEYFNRQITFVDTGEDYLDFELMKRCKHNIIGSSTFSWWAAFLNDNPNKKVIAPAQWLGGWIDNSLIYPNDWIKI